MLGLAIVCVICAAVSGKVTLVRVKKSRNKEGRIMVVGEEGG